MINFCLATAKRQTFIFSLVIMTLSGCVSVQLDTNPKETLQQVQDITWLDVLGPTGISQSDKFNQQDTPLKRDRFAWSSLVELPLFAKQGSGVIVNSKTYRQGVLRVKAQTAGRNSNIGLSLPALGFSGSTTQIDNNGESATNEQASASFSGTLFDWGATIYATKALNANLGAAVFDFDSDIYALAGQLADLTISLEHSYRQLAWWKHRLHRLEQRISFTKQRYASGLASKTQLDTLISLQIEQQIQSNQLQQQHASLLNALKRLAGESNLSKLLDTYSVSADQIEVGASLQAALKAPQALGSINIQTSLSDILAKHPTVQAQSLRVAQSHHNAKALYASLFPSISFNLSQSTADFASNDVSSSLTSSIAGSIFNWGGRINNVAASRLDANRQLESFAQLVVETVSNIQLTYQQDTQTREQFAMRMRQYQTNEARYQQNNRLYQSGLLSWEQLYQSENELISTYLSLHSTLNQWKSQRIQFYVALGLPAFTNQT